MSTTSRRTSWNKGRRTPWTLERIRANCLLTEEGCWQWQGAPRFANGYGAITIERKTYGAHRVALTLAKGPIPPGLIALHSCDNRMCVNPDHLRAGTYADNNADCLTRGRHRSGGTKGEQNGCAKLTASDVLAIRASSVPSEQAAAAYGVSGTLIRRIRRGEQWRHLLDDCPTDTGTGGDGDRGKVGSLGTPPVPVTSTDPVDDPVDNRDGAGDNRPETPGSALTEVRSAVESPSTQRFST